MERPNVRLLNHVAIESNLTIMRRSDTDTAEFRTAIKRVAAFLAYPMTETMDVNWVPIETPLALTNGVVIQKKIALFPVLRSGLLLSSVLEDLLVADLVGVVGIRRNRDTLQPESYYSNIPDDLSGYTCYILDPMLATGRIIATTIKELTRRQAKDIIAVSLLSSNEGIAYVSELFPDVRFIIAHIDSALNDHGYIVPGLGDVGDRAFGTGEDRAVIRIEGSGK